MNFRAYVICAVVIVVANFGFTQETKLRVALFPYLPAASDVSNEALRSRLEKEFEKSHPDVDLELRKFDPWNDDFYDPFWVGGLLKTGGVDLIEIDTVILGTLLDLEAISPWPSDLPKSDWQPIALEAARFQGQIYGVPHWMCGYFIMTRHESVARAANVNELIHALAQLNTAQRNLAGDLIGSWDTAAIYLDAWADTRSDHDVSFAVGLPLDNAVLNQVVSFAALGELAGKNPCIDGYTYNDNDVAPKEFGKGEVDALFGYSERLHYAIEAGADPKSLYIISAPLGDGSDPLWFVDTIVMRNYPKASSKLSPTEKEQYEAEVAKRKRAARAFVDYLNAPMTYAWIHMSEDLGHDSKPRYVIPATKSAFQTKVFTEDPIMRQIKPIITQGTFFPRFQLPGVRRMMAKEIQSAWSKD